MQKIHPRYKQIPDSSEFDKFNWYISFVQMISNLAKLNELLRQRPEAYRIWSPCRQEYCKIYFELILIDRLLYPGYTLVGLKDEYAHEILNYSLNSEKIGYMLGDFSCKLTKEEFDRVRLVALNEFETPASKFNVKIDDNIVISAGPCAGLHGKVKAIHDDGQAVLKVFFMNREITVKTSVADIQSFGGPNGII